MRHSEIVVSEEREYRARMAEWEKESVKDDMLLKAVLVNLRSADKSDYQAFLDVRKQPCTNFYNHNMPGDFYVALRDCVLPPLCGAKSISVIAPHGINVTHGEGHTHNNIYSMDDPNGSYHCPSYNNANQG